LKEGANAVDLFESCLGHRRWGITAAALVADSVGTPQQLSSFWSKVGTISNNTGPIPVFSMCGGFFLGTTAHSVNSPLELWLDGLTLSDSSDNIQCRNR
jgi:hypothetical protein